MSSSIAIESGSAAAHEPRHVRGACPHDCPDTCSLITTVENGVAVRVQGNPEHRPTDGVLCTKVSRYAERTYQRDRVLHPLKRSGPKASGRFERVTWEQALTEIAQRLQGIAAKDPQAILPYSYCGTMGLVQGESMASRFFHRLGASFLDRTICSMAGTEGLTHTIGGKVGMRMEFFAESRLILIWGSNSITSNLHFWRLAQEAKRHGAKLVCIDPRRTETAEKCHEHVQLRPGTDAALALAMMHELIANDWLDHEYLAQHTLGWDALRERALRWSPERASADLRRASRADTVAGARLGHDLACGDPAQLRHAAGARGRQRSARGGLPASPDGRVAPSRRRPAHVELRHLSDPARGAAPSGTSGGPHAAHHQHGHDRG